MDSLAKRIRIARGIFSLEELSQKTGIHKNTLYRYEKGIGVPRVDSLGLIARATGKSITWFFDGNEISSQPTIEKEISPDDIAECSFCSFYGEEGPLLFRGLPILGRLSRALASKDNEEIITISIQTEAWPYICDKCLKGLLSVLNTVQQGMPLPDGVIRKKRHE